MYNKFEIDNYVEGLCRNTLVKSFYPSAIAGALGCDPLEAMARLSELVRDEKLIQKYELRCPNCLNTIKTVEEYGLYLGEVLYCRCGEEVEIGIENILPIYFVGREYQESLKKKLSPLPLPHGSPARISVADVLGQSLRKNEHSEEYSTILLGEISTGIREIGSQLKLANEKDDKGKLMETVEKAKGISECIEKAIQLAPYLSYMLVPLKKLCGLFVLKAY